MWAVRLRHKDKTAKCRFIVVPGDGRPLPGMPDFKVLDILKIMCEMMGDPHKSRVFDPQTVQEANSPTHKTKNIQQIKADTVDANDTNSNTPDYFRSGTKSAVDKIPNEVLTKKIYYEFSDIFSGIGCFEEKFSLKVKDDSWPEQAPQGG